MEDDIVFSLNKVIIPPRVGPYWVYTVVQDPDAPLGILGFACEQQVCDLANPDAPCFVDPMQCNDWGNFQNSLNGGAGAGGGGGDGSGGGGDGNNGSSTSCKAPQCPCPGPAPICGDGNGCCCGTNQFPSTPWLEGFIWKYECHCVPGSVFGGGGTCINPWGPGGGDGQGG